MPTIGKYPVQFVALSFEAILWLKYVVENHNHDFRTVTIDHYPLGWERSWVDCHIEVPREQSHGLPAYPETWENALGERLEAINQELQKGERNVVMASLGDYFADGVVSVITACSLYQCNVPTLAFVTLPSPSRGKRRGTFASQALEKLRWQRQIMPVMVVSQMPVSQALASLVRRLSSLTA
jgi:hypothetical protein